MISFWLRLPVVEMLAALVFVFGAVAICLVLLSFVLPTSPAIRSFRGVVAPFVGSVAVMFAILLGFLANDIWGRQQRAAANVRLEAENLQTLTGLAAAFGLPSEPLGAAVRAYAEAVVSKEWPNMQRGDSAPAAEQALDHLLNTMARLNYSGPGDRELQRLLLDGGVAVINARNARLSLSRDESEELKWLLVLALAMTCQISVALVHLESMKPQIAALALWTASLVFVLGLLALYDAPFASPLAVSPDPIAQMLLPQTGTKTVRQPSG